MRTHLLFVFIVFSTFANAQTDHAENQLMKADRAFSALSQQKGMKYAFMRYIDDTGVLLRKNQYPLIGQQAKDVINNINDSSFTLTWEPTKAFIAKSGELGYTYGIYTTHLKDTVMHGTYVTIWKRQKDGSWKFVLDSGNEGLGK